MSRYLVAGAGGVGGLLASTLSSAGFDTAIVARSQTVARVRERGLVVVDIEGIETVTRPEAYESLSDARPRADDVVVLTCKSYDSPQLLADLREAGPSPRALLCCQNGVRNEEQAGSLFDSVFGLAVYVQARALEPGRVYSAGRKHFVLGRYPSGFDATGESVAQDLEKAGFSVDRSQDIMAAKRSKAVINCGNAVYAISNQPIADRVTKPDLVRLVNLAMAEAREAYRAAGLSFVPVPEWELPQTIETPVPGSGLFFYGSTWEDLTRRKGGDRCEVSWFNGEIVELARKHGLPAPANELLLETCSEMAHERRMPGRYTPGELLEMLSARTGQLADLGGRKPSATSGSSGVASAT